MPLYHPSIRLTSPHVTHMCVCVVLSRALHTYHCLHHDIPLLALSQSPLSPPAPYSLILTGLFPDLILF